MLFKALLLALAGFMRLADAGTVSVPPHCTYLVYVQGSKLGEALCAGKGVGSSLHEAACPAKDYKDSNARIAAYGKLAELLCKDAPQGCATAWADWLMNASTSSSCDEGLSLLRGEVCDGSSSCPP